jgi:hypothetical protein
MQDTGADLSRDGLSVRVEIRGARSPVRPDRNGDTEVGTWKTSWHART